MLDRGGLERRFVVDRRDLPGERVEGGGALLTLGGDLDGARLLLAEDNRVSRVLALKMLRDLGLQVDAAVNGQQAVERAHTGTYDLVLMDVSMPVMDGIEATRAIRALPGWGEVPILAFTGNVFEANRKACLNAGMNGFVEKPIQWRAFWPLLLRWLEHGGDTAMPDD